MQPLINDATTAILRAIRLNFLNFQNLRFEEIRSRSWASATFSGARHELTLLLEGDGAAEAANAFVHGLEAAEFTLRGHIMADIGVVADERGAALGGAPQVRLRIEALTVEEG
ncbi:MAG TPA: hypothetical protein VF589_12945 [Allosphingosinicella sp.]|jgi:hypothetical protein